MAERDEVARLFSAHDARETGDLKHIPLERLLVDDGFKGCRLHLNFSRSPRPSIGARFGSDVDHMNVAIGSEVREGSHDDFSSSGEHAK
jgi:hypothetical protein